MRNFTNSAPYVLLSHLHVHLSDLFQNACACPACMISKLTMSLNVSWKAVVSSPQSGFDKREWILIVGQNKKAAHVAHGSEFTTPVYHLPPLLA